MDELQARYHEAALALAERAARSTLARAGWGPDALDYLATTSCTGRMTPSVDARLVSQLGCRADVQRVHVGDTGCASAMVALQQAWNHLRAFPDHRALVVAVGMVGLIAAKWSVKLLVAMSPAGIARIEGEVLTHNSSMLGLAHVMGYQMRRNPESALFLHASLPLLPVGERGCSPLIKLAEGAKTDVAIA